MDNINLKDKFYYYETKYALLTYIQDISFYNKDEYTPSLIKTYIKSLIIGKILKGNPDYKLFNNFKDDSHNYPFNKYHYFYINELLLKKMEHFDKLLLLMLL